MNFYTLRHWSRDGVPTREHLVALTLQDVIETIGRMDNNREGHRRCRSSQVAMHF